MRCSGGEHAVAVHEAGHSIVAVYADHRIPSRA